LRVVNVDLAGDVLDERVPVRGERGIDLVRNGAPVQMANSNLPNRAGELFRSQSDPAPAKTKIFVSWPYPACESYAIRAAPVLGLFDRAEDHRRGALD
jgi:hypothetical protein